MAEPQFGTDSMEEAAFHEAGHAVVGALLGCRISEVSILNTNGLWEGQCHFQGPQFSTNESLKYALDLVSGVETDRGRTQSQMAIAGILAQAKRLAEKKGECNSVSFVYEGPLNDFIGIITSDNPLALNAELHFAKANSATTTPVTVRGCWFSRTDRGDVKCRPESLTELIIATMKLLDTQANWNRVIAVAKELLSPCNRNVDAKFVLNSDQLSSLLLGLGHTEPV